VIFAVLSLNVQRKPCLTEDEHGSLMYTLLDPGWRNSG
jgi:hypothetical protein